MSMQKTRFLPYKDCHAQTFDPGHWETLHNRSLLAKIPDSHKARAPAWEGGGRTSGDKRTTEDKARAGGLEKPSTHTHNTSMYRNAYAGAKKYKAGISPPVRRVSRQATGGSRGDVVTVSHLRHLVTLPGATGCGYVMYQRGGGAARSTPNITSLGVWRTMRAALPSRPLSSPPPAGWAAGAGPGLSGAVAGQDRR
ncbi:hypothetical protein GWK47_004532 [Chionoecetes opilio]|uniref:Uncharacterized protein n=1 Tax=Chionoecetes opilio TaxID=41210 RepID=A0A8J4YG16_CHIOP|nr:hypothetical protein GWK47_004532 [Chionoecetes opilio]